MLNCRSHCDGPGQRSGFTVKPEKDNDPLVITNIISTKQIKKGDKPNIIDYVIQRMLGFIDTISN